MRVKWDSESGLEPEAATSRQVCEWFLELEARLLSCVRLLSTWCLEVEATRVVVHVCTRTLSV